MPVLSYFRNELDRQECLSLPPLPLKSQNVQTPDARAEAWGYRLSNRRRSRPRRQAQLFDFEGGYEHDVLGYRGRQPLTSWTRMSRDRDSDRTAGGPQWHITFHVLRWIIGYPRPFFIDHLIGMYILRHRPSRRRDSND